MRSFIYYTYMYIEPDCTYIVHRCKKKKKRGGKEKRKNYIKIKQKILNLDPFALCMSALAAK